MKTNETTPIPQGYKATPLGIIPQEWEVKKLGEVGKLFSGLTYTPSNIQSDGILVLRSSNIQNGMLAFDDNVYVNVASYTPVKAGDILICVRNGSQNLIGKTALITQEVEGCAFGAFMAVFRSPISKYVFYLLDTDIYRKYIFRNLGATINSINGSDLKKFRFLFPPLSEQKKIAEVLGLWDKAIEKQSQLIEQLTLRKRGLMQQLLTGKKRLLGFSGEWKKEKAGSIFENSSVRSNKSEPLLSATQEYGVVPRDMLETRVTMPSGNLSSFKRVDIGDFVISLRSFEGGIEYSKYSGIVSPAYTVLKKKHNVNDIFYKAYFKSHEFIQRLAIAVIGIRDGKQISYSDFCYIRIPLPSIIEQTAIAQVLTAADREIELAQQKLELLRQQKRGLMQQLLTGKKRVKI